jgi:hypothetical protein
MPLSSATNYRVVVVVEIAEYAERVKMIIKIATAVVCNLLAASLMACLVKLDRKLL